MAPMRKSAKGGGSGRANGTTSLLLAAIALFPAGCATEGGLGLRVEPMSVVRHGMQRAQALYLLGRQHHRTGAFEKAELAYVQSLAADPSSVPAHVALGVLYADRGQTSRAIEQLRHALTLSPRAAHVWNNLGFAYFQAGRYAEAEEALRNALAIEPDNAHARRNLTQVSRVWQGSVATAQRHDDAHDAAAGGTSEAPAGANGGAPVRILSPEAVAVAFPVRSDAQDAAALSTSEARAGANGEAPVRPPTAEAVAVAFPLRSLPASAPVVLPAKKADLATTSTQAPSAAAAPIEARDKGRIEYVRDRADLIQVAPHVFELRVASFGGQPRNPLTDRGSIRRPDSPKGETVRGNAPVEPLQIEIVNGNGIFRFARDTAAFLKPTGFVTVRTLDKPPFKEAQTEIQYRPGSRADAQRLRHNLADKPLLKEVADLAPEIAARLLLGRDSTPATLLQAANPEQPKPLVSASASVDGAIRQAR